MNDLLQSIRAFQESRVLLTALELDLLPAVGAGAGAAEVAGRIGADPRATEMLLNALTALGVLVKRDGRFQCTGEAAALGAARDGLMHSVHLWESWSTLTACVKTGTAVHAPGVEGHAEAWTAAFIRAMQARAQGSAPQLVANLGAAGVRRLLDVGGGPGTYAIAFAQANPELRAEILDLAPVIPMAQANIDQAGLAGRVQARAGDLRRDDFGRGYDLILASAICHMLDEAENQDLIRRCGQALAPGGRLAICEFILDPDRAGPPRPALFALNMLVGTRGGNSYTEADYRRWLEAAGFRECRRPDPAGDLLIGIL